MKFTQDKWVYAALAVATVAAYWPVRNCDFVIFDDEVYISRNLHVQSGLTLAAVRWAFTTDETGNWHPLTWLSHTLDCRLFGQNPQYHHLVNLLFHIVNVLLLFWVLKDMTGALWRSAFVAAAFALHPLHVESVAWVSERKDVLSAMFWLLAMAAYLRYARRHSIVWYMVTLFLFALGLMAKPMLVTLPFALLLLDYWPLERLNRNAIYEKMPFFTLSAVSSVVTFLWQKSGGAVNKIETISIASRLANALISYAKYIVKMFWPADLAMPYLHPVNKIPLRQTVAAALLLLLISAAVITAYRNRRWLVTGWLWYLGTLVPVIGLVQVGNQAMADRYSYIPLTGLFIIIAWGASELLLRWQYRKIVPGIFILTAILALAVCTRLQLRYWQNSTVLCKRAIAVTNNNYVAYYGLGITLCKQGKFDEGIKYLAESLRIRPNNYDSYYNIALALTLQGRFDEAVNQYRQALEIWPGAADAHNNLGVILMTQGKVDEAITHFRQAIHSRPDWLSPLNSLSWILAAYPDPRIRDANQALAIAGHAAELTGYQDAMTLNTLSVAYAAVGQPAKAVEMAEKALQLASTEKNEELVDYIRRQLQVYKEMHQ